MLNNKWLFAGLGLLIGLLIGLANTPEVEYRTDDRFDTLKQVDEDIFDKYREGINQAVIILECIDDNPCLEEATDEVEQITEDINALYDKRKEI